MSAPFNDHGPFAVGEICIFQNAEKRHELNGSECVVLQAGVQVYSFLTEVWHAGYEVRFASGAQGRAIPRQLRRRKPPAADSHERTYMQKWRDMAGKAPQRVGEVA